MAEETEQSPSPWFLYGAAFFCFVILAVGVGFLVLKSKVPGWDDLARQRVDEMQQKVEGIKFGKDDINPFYNGYIVNGSEITIPYCGEVHSGYRFQCKFTLNAYEIKAAPVLKNITGRSFITSGRSLDVIKADTPQAVNNPTPASSSPRTRGTQESTITALPAGPMRKNIPDGIHNENYDTGELKVASNYQGGLKHGEEKTYYKSGQVKVETFYFEGTKEGPEVMYAESGSRASEWPYEKGKLNGKVKFFGGDGSVLKEVPYVNGSREGMEISYGRDGRISMETPFKNNVMNGTVNRYFPDGTLKKETPHVNNVIHGTARSYYADGAVEEEVEYAQNKLVHSKRYDLRGNIIETNLYQDGRLRTTRKFDPQGRVFEEVAYDDSGKGRWVVYQGSKVVADK